MLRGSSPDKTSGARDEKFHWNPEYTPVRLRTIRDRTRNGLNRPPKISVIVPFYNEEDSIGPMYAAIVAAVRALQILFEMVFVDDGSADATALRGEGIPW